MTSFDADRRRAFLAYAAPALLWITTALTYFHQTPPGVRSHDLLEHIQYTEVIRDQHRFPAPMEGWEMWQPPLYYWLAAQLPAYDSVQTMRRISILLGAGTLFAVLWALRRLSASPVHRALIGCALVSTPAFCFLFTGYNNDVLVTFLNVVMLSVTWRLMMPAPPGLVRGLSILLFAAAALGAYAKYSAGPVILLCAAGAAWAGYRRRIPRRRAAGVALTALLGGALLAPWLVLHNRRLTGRLFPTNFDQCDTNVGILSPREFLIPHRVTEQNFRGPYARGQTDFISFDFISSLYGEYSPDYGMEHHAPEIFLWLLLGIQAVLGLWSVVRGSRTWQGRIALAAITVAIATHLSFVFSHPNVVNLNFRYVAWSWLPWWALYFAALLASERRVETTAATACVAAWAAIGTLFLRMVG